jgi:hypothetical protein
MEKLASPKFVSWCTLSDVQKKMLWVIHAFLIIHACFPFINLDIWEFTAIFLVSFDVLEDKLNKICGL